MFVSKLKQALICLKAGRVTLPYPFAPATPADGFRGLPRLDVEKCVGCAGCAEVCPTRCIQVSDPCQERRVLEFYLDRCSYCGRCQEVCPEGAITLGKEFETACADPNDLRIQAEIWMGTCQRCGRCYTPPTSLDRMMVTGFRDGKNGDGHV